MVTKKHVSKWTAADEAKLKQLIEKKKNTHDYHVSKLDDFAEAQWHTQQEPRLLFVQHLIEFSKQYRDLLEPFDDGRRPEIAECAE